MFSPPKKKEIKVAFDHELKKTRESFFSRVKNIFFRKSKLKVEIDIDVLDHIEEILLSSDIGTKTTIKIINNLEKRIKKEKYEDNQKLYEFLKEEMKVLFMDVIKNESLERTIKYEKKPYVIMMIGVNGVGKTTTIGKLAFFLKKKGFNLIIGASDTFRAAAIRQLEIWSKKVNIPLIKQQHMQADPASVAYDTLQSAKSKNTDVVLIDTAGRLQNKIGLMEELSKISRVMKKVIPEAPHEIMLVLDATTGQNAFEQVKKFSSFVKVSSIILTKLEGTAKGGVVIGIMDQFKIPIKYIGIGEKIQDLKEFDGKKFIDSFFISTTKEDIIQDN
ncbi:signal recognition particle-docking protein FtsY [Blattabacterium sp. (Cryptocercus kyebangensis)]|uniref:signal recognition particle-docking protein FtsY n=1 Tax=Blattabacterium sp. (Cryptocercus kyebangensis) TaxID=298656 RepID=UPI000D7C263D|nr:signal recognition particle-docking protein FtsY [Blattabacterium sp. (Cryptocercus kyebangensis)]AWU43904.1 signal recognition particle-docking protein FtsY [Blattabacterium sp. (Cryptocercus kyebangensis)]